MSVGFKSAAANPGDLADEKFVNQDAQQIDHRACCECGDVGRERGPEQQVYAKEREEVVGRIHAQHHEIALGEVDHAHDAKNKAEADAHQPILGAGQ